MRKGWWIVLVLIMLALLLVGILLLQPTEPVYQGKRLSAWVSDLPWTMPGFTFGRGRIRRASMTVNQHSPVGSFSVTFTNIAGVSSGNADVPLEAIRNMGTNSLPILLEMLRAKDSAVKLAILSLLSRQSFVRVPCSLAVQKRHQALTAIVALGPAAKPAVPALLKFAQDKDRAVREAASFAVRQIDAEAAAKAGLN